MPPSAPRASIIADRVFSVLGSITDANLYHYTNYETREFRGQDPDNLPTLDLHYLGNQPDDRRTSMGGAHSYASTLRLGVTAWGADESSPRLIAQKMEADVKTAILTQGAAQIGENIEHMEWSGTAVTLVSVQRIGAARVEMAFDFHYFEAVGAPELEGV